MIHSFDFDRIFSFGAQPRGSGEVPPWQVQREALALGRAARFGGGHFDIRFFAAKRGPFTIVDLHRFGPKKTLQNVSPASPLGL